MICRGEEKPGGTEEDKEESVDGEGNRNGVTTTVRFSAFSTKCSPEDISLWTSVCSLGNVMPFVSDDDGEIVSVDTGEDRPDCEGDVTGDDEELEK